MLFLIYTSTYSTLIIITLLISGMFSLFNYALKKYKWYNFCCALMFFAYIFVILYITIFCRESSAENRNICLIPFNSYLIAFRGNEEGFRTCFMNMLLFYPLGCLFLGVNSKIKVRYLILFAFVLSLIIEIMQYIFGLGYSEMDDLIHNTMGVIISYYVVLYMSNIICKIKYLFKSKNKDA